jgi:hypothetical protein
MNPADRRYARLANPEQSVRQVIDALRSHEVRSNIPAADANPINADTSVRIRQAEMLGARQ